MVYAHARRDDEGNIVDLQTLEEHSLNVAKIAADNMDNTLLRSSAKLAGIIHDMGKAKKEFQIERLLKNDSKKLIVHTFACCKYILDKYHFENKSNIDKTAEIIAYAASAHHGLYDVLDSKHQSGFLYRITKDDICYEESRDKFFKECISEDEVEEIFEESCSDLDKVYKIIDNISGDSNKEQKRIINCNKRFYSALIIRMILSAVIEGDHSDAARFDGLIDHKLEYDWNELLIYLEEMLKNKPHDTDISKARQWISNQCKERAVMPEGIYTLNTPTGGGKTLSALRYALAHAKVYEKKRIIIVAPFLSIIDQSVDDIRKNIGDSGNIVLEHHSNVLRQNDDNSEINDIKKMAMENWHAPIIVSTMAQLLLTMFSGKKSAIRRFHALVNSVIIIDEVQTIPLKMMSLFNLTINFLSQVCHSTVILCSATQPNFTGFVHAMLPANGELVPYNEDVWKVFERTKIVYESAALSIEEIASYTKSVLVRSNSVLIICNKKAQAKWLYEALKDEDIDCYHLSTGMCAAHRRNVINRMKVALVYGNKKVLCVSTQLIEAGVDISFHSVIRFLAGIDHIVQAAGRCNRHGEDKRLASVYVVKCSDEKLGKLTDIRKEQAATERVIYKYLKDNNMNEQVLNITGEIINSYYSELYKSEYNDAEFDYIVKDVGGEVKTILDFLSTNSNYANMKYPHCKKYHLRQSFEEAGRYFDVYDSETIDIVVRYGDGNELIEELKMHQNHIDVAFLKEWNKKVQSYTIGLYTYQIEEIKKSIEVVEGVRILSSSHYDEEIGYKEVDDSYLEV